MNNINREINEEKAQLIKIEDNAGELEINPNLKKKEKFYNIEVEENIEIMKENDDSINKNSKTSNLEVKGLEFTINEPITNSILYDGRLFVKDRHQSKVNTDIINYRCKNYRKFENQKIGSFCKALVKRKNSKIL